MRFKKFRGQRSALTAFQPYGPNMSIDNKLQAETLILSTDYVQASAWHTCPMTEESLETMGAQQQRQIDAKSAMCSIRSTGRRWQR